MLEIPVDLGARRYTVSIGHGLLASLPRPARAARGRRQRRGRRTAASGRCTGRGWSGPLSKLGPLAAGAHPRRRAPQVPRRPWRPSTTRCWQAGLGRDGAGGRLRRRRRGRRGRLRRRHLHARHRLGQVPTTLLAMVDSSVGGKVGDQPPGGQEPDRRLPPAAGGGHRPQPAGDAAAARVPQRRLRDPEVRRPRRPRALREPAERAPRACAGWDRRRHRERDRRRLPDQGRRGGEGRARGRPAPGAEPRPHDRPRAGDGDALPALHARRGGGLGPDRRRLDRAAARACSPSRAFDAIAAAVDRLGPRPRVSDLAGRRCWTRSPATRRRRTGRVAFVLPTADRPRRDAARRPARRDPPRAQGHGRARSARSG